MFYGLGHGISKNPRMMEHFAALAQEQQNVRNVIAGALGILSGVISSRMSHSARVESYMAGGKMSESDAEAEANAEDAEDAMWQRITSAPAAMNKPRP